MHTTSKREKKRRKNISRKWRGKERNSQKSEKYKHSFRIPRFWYLSYSFHFSYILFWAQVILFNLLTRNVIYSFTSISRSFGIDQIFFFIRIKKNTKLLVLLCKQRRRKFGNFWSLIRLADWSMQMLLLPLIVLVCLSFEKIMQISRKQLLTVQLIAYQ